MRCAISRLMVVLALLAFPVIAQAEELKEISGSGITVSYPPKMEAQAKKVLNIAVTSLQPSIEIHRQIAALLSDPGALAKSITDLLGAEECTEKTKVRLLAYKDKSDGLVQSFSHIRLMEKGTAVATGGVDAGIIQVRYVKDSDEFNMVVLQGADAAGKASRSYFPVFINADGSIRGEKKLADMAIDFLGSSKAMIVAPVHETVNNILTEQLKLYHPFTRWFTEGVSGWATKRIVQRADSTLLGLVQEMFGVSPASAKARAEINLLAWPQSGFQNRTKGHFDAALEAAQTQYSVELIGKYLGSNRNGELAKVIGLVKNAGNPDTDAICAAMQKVSGSDFKKTLLDYVPAEVKAGIASGASKKLAAQAEKLVGQKKWKEAAEKLREGLQMSPDDVNSRINLAWIERETGERLDSEIQVFIAAALLRQKEYSFHMFAGSVEGNYVLGRLAMLVGNLEQARQFLEPVLIAKPDHADAKRAMEEIKTMESMLKSSGS